MRWFGRDYGKDADTGETEVESDFEEETDSAGSSGEKYPEHLETMAKEAEAEARKQADDLMASYVAEHEAQTAGYSFECRRWGDFLSVFIGRSANSEDRQSWWVPEPAPKKHSTSVNIAQTRELKFIAGHAPDQESQIGFWLSMRHDQGGSSWGTSYGHFAPSNGWRYEVTPQIESAPKWRPMFRLDEKPDDDRHDMICDDDSYRIRHRMVNFPRPAEDDRIRFEGIDATIYAPAGMGQAVYDAILAEIAAYKESA